MNQSAAQKNNLQISDDSCVLVAEVTGDGPLIAKLGQKEADRAVERCRSRAARSIEAYQGQTVRSEGRRLVAVFQRSDNAVLAANDIRDRINQLPPVSGVSLSVRVGVHSGRVEGADSADGDAMIEFICKRMADAPPGQVFLSGEATAHLSESMRNQIYSQTQLSAMRADGEEDSPLYELGSAPIGIREMTLPPPSIARSAAEATASGVQRSKPAAAAAGARTRLMVKFMNGTFVVSESHPTLLAGRDEGNDVVVSDRRVSRQHARVEWRAGRYVLIDTSTNGTFLLDDNGVEVVLRRGECELPATGRIGFGYSPQEPDVEVCSFDIAPRA